MEKLFCEKTLYKIWNSSAEEEKSKLNGHLQNRATMTFSWSPGHLFTCKLLFTLSYNAGAGDDVMEWTGAQFKTNKSKYFLHNTSLDPEVWDLWGWLSWATTQAATAASVREKANSWGTAPCRYWKDEGGMYPWMPCSIAGLSQILENGLT